MDWHVNGESHLECDYEPSETERTESYIKDISVEEPLGKRFQSKWQNNEQQTGV